jgi:hypothetical protein
MFVKKWKFKLESDFQIDLKKYSICPEDCYFYDSINGIRVKVGFLAKGVLHIFKGYEWDGCTPKFNLFGKLIGTPDFKGTYNSSLVHDFLIEFHDQHSLTRKEIDYIFEYIMKDESFKLRWIYSTGVHLFRPIALKLRASK